MESNDKTRYVSSIMASIFLIVACIALIVSIVQSENKRTDELLNKFYNGPSTTAAKTTTTSSDCKYGHVWVKATCTKPRSCLLCDQTQGEVAEHNYRWTDCAKNGICKDCGAEGSPRGNHIYGAYNCKVPKSCTKCNFIEGTLGDHNLIDGACSLCGYIEFETLTFSGSGDYVITDIDLPRGVFVAKINIDSTNYYSVKFHYLDSYNLLVSNSREPYAGTVLIKGRSVEPMSDGILEINTTDEWTIEIYPLKENCTNNIAGTGDTVTGWLSGSGNLAFEIFIDSTAYYSVKLFEVTNSLDYIGYDLLVSDSREIYSGTVLGKLKSDRKYFFVVVAEGHWTISYGDDDLTEYIDGVTSSDIPESQEPPTNTPTYPNDPTPTTPEQEDPVEPTPTEPKPTEPEPDYGGGTLEQYNALLTALEYLDAMPFSYQGLIDQLLYEGYSKSEATFAADRCLADWNEQALRDAKSYLSHMPFSYVGLIGQLEYEGYTTAEATYAADNCGADWYEQAVIEAKSYIEHIDFSKAGLIQQLQYEGYTKAEAEYGVEHCEADWYEQAVLSARSYLEIMNFSREQLIQQLLYEGFTREEAVYAADICFQ